MFALHEELAHFAAAIVADQKLTAQAVCPKYPIATAMAVYRNNYRGNLQDTLAYIYPVVQQLVGEDFFHYMAQQFIDRYPSKSGNLHLYGAELSPFIASFEPARSLLYLADIAMLEWYCHCAYFAQDSAALNVAELASISEADYADLVLFTQPSFYVMHSRYPVAAIWHAHQNDDIDNFEIKSDHASSYTLQISRQYHAVIVSELTEADAAWVKNIQMGIKLGPATDTVLAHYPDFNLEVTLLKFITQGVITGFTVEKNE